MRRVLLLPLAAVAVALLTATGLSAQGGALQQAGMIHVLGSRVDLGFLRRCHEHLTTTSYVIDPVAFVLAVFAHHHPFLQKLAGNIDGGVE